MFLLNGFTQTFLQKFLQKFYATSGLTRITSGSFHLFVFIIGKRNIILLYRVSPWIFLLFKCWHVGLVFYTVIWFQLLHSLCYIPDSLLCICLISSMYTFANVSLYENASICAPLVFMTIVFVEHFMALYKMYFFCDTECCCITTILFAFQVFCLISFIYYHNLQVHFLCFCIDWVQMVIPSIFQQCTCIFIIRFISVFE